MNHGPLLAGLLLALCAGCPQSSSSATVAAPQGGAAGGGGAFAERIKIKDGAGATAFELKRMDDGLKVVDANEVERFRLKAKDGKVKLRDPQDVVLGYVKFSDGHFKVKDASQERTLFSLRQQADGDWKLENERDEQLCEIKRRDYGWVIRDPQERDLYKVKVDGGKTSLRDAQDQTRYATHDPVSGLAFVALGFDALDEGQRLALLYQIQASGK